MSLEVSTYKMHQLYESQYISKPSSLMEYPNWNFLRWLNKLASLNHITAKTADDANEQFSNFIDNIIPKNREKFRSFSMFDQRLDTFLTEYLLDKEFASLELVFIIIFCLSHGQSYGGRGVPIWVSR